MLLLLLEITRHFLTLLEVRNPLVFPLQQHYLFHIVPPRQLDFRILLLDNLREVCKDNVLCQRPIVPCYPLHVDDVVDGGYVEPHKGCRVEHTAFAGDDSTRRQPLLSLQSDRMYLAPHVIFSLINAGSNHQPARTPLIGLVYVWCGVLIDGRALSTGFGGLVMVETLLVDYDAASLADDFVAVINDRSEGF